MTQKVIIIGIGFASRLGLIRAVAQTGAEISVIAIGHKEETMNLFTLPQAVNQLLDR